jgi:hypothetical protein
MVDAQFGQNDLTDGIPVHPLWQALENTHNVWKVVHLLSPLVAAPRKRPLRKVVGDKDSDKWRRDRRLRHLAGQLRRPSRGSVTELL